MEPASIVTGIVGRLAAPLATALAQAGKAKLLGTRQQQAMERALRRSAERAVAAYPTIAEISAEIDLLADARPSSRR